MNRVDVNKDHVQADADAIRKDEAHADAVLDNMDREAAARFSKVEKSRRAAVLAKEPPYDTEIL